MPYFIANLRFRQLFASEPNLRLSELIPVDLPHVLKAGEFKALHKIPCVDCMAAALAAMYQATLVTSDRDFEKLGKQFPILWIAGS